MTMIEAITPPDNMVCPLTLETFIVPLVDSVTKRSYERSAILKWIYSGNGTCPLTRLPLRLENFSVNKKLMSEIYEWRQENGLLLTDEEDQAQEDNTLHLQHQVANMPSSPAPEVPSYLKCYL